MTGLLFRAADRAPASGGCWRARRWSNSVPAALALTFFAGVVSACSVPDASLLASSEVVLHPEDWEGVYQGPYHIYLGIETDGAEATGSWQAVGERSGLFSGRISGERLNITWEEHGDSGSWSGRGYFVYRPAQDSQRAEIFGERGFGSSAVGSSWWALKRPDSPSPADVRDTSRGGDDDDRQLTTTDEAEFEP